MKKQYQSLPFRDIVPFFKEAVEILGTSQSEIKHQDTDVFCKCPVCGDSRHGNKKRLHLYQKGDVINVNCFNGDCSVKNMTPYSFFKEYCPSIFHQYNQFYRKRFFNDLKPIKDQKLQSAQKLETVTASENDLFLVSGNEQKECAEDENNYIKEIMKLISEFQFTGDDEVDVENFRSMSLKIKGRSIVAFASFRKMLAL